MCTYRMLIKHLSFIILCSSLTTTMCILFSFSFHSMHQLNKHEVAYEDATFVELKVKARMGNQLFAYAALRSFASMKNCTAIILPDHEDIAAIFKINPANHTFVSRNGFTKFVEMRRNLSGTLQEMLRLQPANITLEGFFQSPQYFVNIRHELRIEFTFQDNIAKTARDYLNSVVPTSWQGEDYIQVSIHVRRSDHISYKFIEILGFNFPSDSYFILAMNYFTKKHKRVQFIVGSEDMVWCKSYFSKFQEHIIFSENHTEIEDMAILSSCDHAITTIGTFSWWVGWLCKGNTLYYNYYYRRGSWAAMVHHQSHYIPQDEYNHWIPISQEDDKKMYKRKKITPKEWLKLHGTME